MRDQDAFLRAGQAMENAIEQVRDDQWWTTIPPVFANNTGLPTLRDVVGRMAYDEAWVPDLLAGRTMEEVGSNAYDGDLLGGDPKGSYARIAAAARDAGRRVGDRDRPVHLVR